jgi:hypothetical protein
MYEFALNAQLLWQRHVCHLDESPDVVKSIEYNHSYNFFVLFYVFITYISNSHSCQDGYNYLTSLRSFLFFCQPMKTIQEHKMSTVFLLRQNIMKRAV